MTTLQELISEAEEIFSEKWETRDGRKVPGTDDIQLGNDAIKIDGTVLYADMADSTELVKNFKPWFAAKIYKTYLRGACRIIQNNGGEITAFDGDRVMAVFIGNYKNSSATKTALQINAYVADLNKMITQAYPKTSYSLQHSIGIDTSNLFVAKTGIRTYNDLVWVGRAANYAAKLCTLADETYSTYITEDVFKKLSDEIKKGGQPRQLMWEKRIWTKRGIVVYRSAWMWSF